jgi:hypothetical protein
LSVPDHARLVSALETVQYLDLLTRDLLFKAEDSTAKSLGLADSVFGGRLQPLSRWRKVQR